MKKYQQGGGLIAVPQAFRPDFDFLYKVGKERQTRYNAAERELGGIYSSLLNSPLTHEDNNQRRDAWFKSSQAALDQITGLDLSLQSNLRSAKDVFDPIIEDKYIAHDMAWSKRLSQEARKAEMYKTSDDPAVRSKAWTYGDAYLNIQRERFAGSSLDETLNMGAPRYVSQVDIQGLASETVKKFFGDDALLSTTVNGGWVVKTKNGPVVYDQMNALIHNAIQNDPAVRDMYRVMYEVNEDQFIKSSGFASADEARLAFAEQVISDNEEVVIRDFYGKQRAIQDLTEGINLKRSEFKKTGVVPGSSKHREVLDQLAILSGLKNSPLTSEDERAIGTPAESIMDMRNKALSVFAGASAIKDAQNAARLTASRGYSVDVDENEYGLISARAKADADLAKLKAQLSVWEAWNKPQTSGTKGKGTGTNLTGADIGLPGGVGVETAPAGGTPVTEMNAGQMNEEAISTYTNQVLGDMTTFIQKYSIAAGNNTVVLPDGNQIAFRDLPGLMNTREGRDLIISTYGDMQKKSRTLFKDNVELATLRATLEVNGAQLSQITDEANAADRNIAQSWLDINKGALTKAHQQLFINPNTGRPVSLDSYITMYAQANYESVEDATDDATDEYQELMERYTEFYNRNATYSAYNAFSGGDGTTGGLGTGSGSFPAFTTTFSGSNLNPESVNMLKDLNISLTAADRFGGQVIYQAGGLAEVGKNSAELQQLYQRIMADVISRQGDSDAPVFTMKYQSVAGGDGSKAGYQITLDSEYLKKWTDGDDDAAKLLADSNMQDLTFSIVFDKDYDRSSYRYTNQRVDGVQSQLASSGDGNLYYEGPYGSSVRFTQMADGSTRVMTRFGALDPKTGELTFVEGSRMIMGGPGIFESELADFNSKVTQIAKQNEALQKTINDQLGTKNVDEVMP